MSKISKYFSRGEFACKCGCGFSVVDVQLLELLTLVREYFDSPVTINSACRCEKHNKSVGGTSGSKHKQGIAVDIKVKGVDTGAVYDFIDRYAPNSCGLGWYEYFVHVDVRSDKARW